MNKNFITELEIRNFKSIKEMKLRCKRINLFIGRPNVGKSNILEALALFSAPYLLNEPVYLGDLVRFNDNRNFFYWHIFTHSIT
ncbi:MAG: AAA family ATPase [Bacteroidia bacterium]